MLALSRPTPVSAADTARLSPAAFTDENLPGMWGLSNKLSRVDALMAALRNGRVLRDLSIFANNSDFAQSVAVQGSNRFIALTSERYEYALPDPQVVAMSRVSLRLAMRSLLYRQIVSEIGQAFAQYIAAATPVRLSALYMTINDVRIDPSRPVVLRRGQMPIVRVFAVPHAPGGMIKTAFGIANDLASILAQQAGPAARPQQNAMLQRQAADAFNDLRMVVASGVQNNGSVMAYTYLGDRSTLFGLWAETNRRYIEVSEFDLPPVEITGVDSIVLRSFFSSPNDAVRFAPTLDFRYRLNARTAGEAYLSFSIAPGFEDLWRGGGEPTTRTVRIVVVDNNPPIPGPPLPPLPAPPIPPPPGPPPPPPLPPPPAPPPLPSPPPAPKPLPAPAPFPKFQTCGPDNGGSLNPRTGECEYPK